MQFEEDLLKGRGGDWTEHLSWRWRVLPGRSGPRPALVELDKEERVFKGPSVDDGLHQVNECHDHKADEEEGDEGPQVVPGHPEPVAKAADPGLPPGVRGVAGGVRDWSATGGLVI